MWTVHYHAIYMGLHLILIKHKIIPFKLFRKVDCSFAKSPKSIKALLFHSTNFTKLWKLIARQQKQVIVVNVNKHYISNEMHRMYSFEEKIKSWTCRCNASWTVTLTRSTISTGFQEKPRLLKYCKWQAGGAKLISLLYDNSFYSF